MSEIAEQLLVPKISKGFLRVWQRNFFYFRKTWTVSLFWIILEPLMYLGGIGYGLGSFVNNVDGASYLEFFFPGLLCSTAMMVSFFESTYGSYSKLTYQNTYATIMLTRLGPEEIVFGEILWSASKGFFGVCGVTLVASVLGLVESMRIFPVLIFLFMTCLMFSAIGMIFTSLARNYDSFIYATSGFIVPMSLFAGTYFPLTQLPGSLKYFAYLFPLTHAVEAVRGELSDGFTLKVAMHVLVLAIISYFCLIIAINRLRDKMLR